MRTLLLLLTLLCSPLSAQVMDVQAGYIVSGLKNALPVGDYIVVDRDSLPKLEQVAIIRVNSDASNIVVKVSNKERSIIPATKIDNKTYVVIGSGKLWVRVVCVDFSKNIFVDEETTVEVGPPPEPVPPPPGPTPDVPPDVFDNIGQRVAQWAKGLPSNAELGKIYLERAKNLKSNPNTTINEESALLTADLKKVPTYSQYASFSEKLNNDLNTRWKVAPMSKGLLADYWTCIALGLGVK